MIENQEVAPVLDATTQSSTKSGRAVPSFSASVLTHLKQIYESLSQTNLNGESNFTLGIQNDEIAGISAAESQHDPLESLASFLTYMASPTAKANRHAEPLDLSAPISNYFISSSHNTYLTGNQLYGDASIDSYTNVSVFVIVLCSEI